jgi:hypothetical protein
MRALLAIAVLLVACNPCRKAQGLLNKAVRICPEMAQLRTDTLRTTLPGDSTAGNVDYYGEDLDSVAAACSQLQEALLAERELYRISIDAASRVVLRTRLQVDSLKKVLASKRTAVDRLRGDLCLFPSVYDSTALHRLRIWSIPSGMDYDLLDYPREVEQVHTVPQVTQGPVIIRRHGPWWLWLWAIGASVLAAYHYLKSDHFRYHYERLKR